MELRRPGSWLGWRLTKKYPEAKHLSYAKFSTKYVYKLHLENWILRQYGFSIRRLFDVPPGSGEKCYFRILLNIANDPENYDVI